MGIYISIKEELSADIIVCGGGPAGIAAALSAARNGSKVILLERGSYLGGASTAAGISTFAYGYHDKERYILKGIFYEIRQRLYERNALIKTKRHGWEPYNQEEYKVLLDEMLEEAGVRVVFNVFVCHVVKTDGFIEYVVAAGKSGFIAFKGKMFIDATGDGDLSALSDVEYSIGRENDNKMQPMTQGYMIGGVDIKKAGECQERGFWLDEKGRGYLNATGFYEFINNACEQNEWEFSYKGLCSVWTIPWLPGTVGINLGRVEGLCGVDTMDMTKASITGRKQAGQGIKFLKKYVPGFENAYITCLADTIGVRETRRIHGLYTLSQEDIINYKQFDDVIAQSCYMIDVHSPDKGTTHIFKLEKGKHYDIPYRSLVPEGVNNLIVAGRCISTTQNALGSVRVQPICMGLGQAAGAAASLCIKLSVPNHMLDIGILQEKLLEQGAVLN